MFTASDVQARLHQRPFVPIRFITSAGEAHDVDHPDMVLVGRRFLIVGVPTSDDPSLVEQVTRLSMLHLTEMLDLPLPTSHKNGTS